MKPTLIIALLTGWNATVVGYGVDGHALAARELKVSVGVEHLAGPCWFRVTMPQAGSRFGYSIWCRNILRPDLDLTKLAHPRLILQ